MGAAPSKLVSELADESREGHPCRKRMIFSMVASWYSWDHLWVQRLVGQRAGQRELLAGVPTPPPHLMPLKVSTACMSSGRAWGSGHLKPSMTGTIFLPQLKAVTISWRKKKGGGRDPGPHPGTGEGQSQPEAEPRVGAGPEIHLDFSLTPCGVIKNKYLVFILGS